MPTALRSHHTRPQHFRNSPQPPGLANGETDKESTLWSTEAIKIRGAGFMVSLDDKLPLESLEKGGVPRLGTHAFSLSKPLCSTMRQVDAVMRWKKRQDSWPGAAQRV